MLAPIVPWRLLRLALAGALCIPVVAACTFTGAPLGSVRPSSPRATALAETAPDDYVPPLAYAPAGRGASASGVNAAIGRYAALYEVPESLIRRIIVRESNYNPAARHGPYWGLMQIRYDTARSMGYDGAPSGLLEADTNLRYAVKYLAGAYRVAGGIPDRAAAFYASGYYYDARRMGLLDEVGLKRGKH
ncbi:MAG: transglycosylase SLT domain-containing protein [Devosia sp.]